LTPNLLGFAEIFLGKLALKFFFVAKVLSLLTIQFEADRGKK